MSNIDRMRDEQLKNEKDEAEGSSFFYRQTRLSVKFYSVGKFFQKQ